MKIISWNTNGIRATIKANLFLPLLEQNNPDILCLQETKCSPDQLSGIDKNPNGYHSYFSSSKIKKGYSGVAIYTKIIPEKVEYGIGIPEFDDEGRTVVAYYPKTKTNKEFVLINCYFPNGGGGEIRLDYKMRFYDAFLKFCNKLVKNGHNVIFTGDVNTAHQAVDLARPKENEKNTGFLPMERAWIDKVIENDFIDTFRLINKDKKDAYSYWDQKTGARARNVGWRIDYFFVSKTLEKDVKDSFMITDYLGSDHCPICLIAFC